MNLIIDPVQEEKRITRFIRETLAKTKLDGIVVAVSGGVDSAIVLTLVVKAIGPQETYALLLPYGNLSSEPMVRAKAYIEMLGLPAENVRTIDITPIVHTIVETLKIPESEVVRIGNIMARSRMIVLYDYAKKHGLLVCGTENRSEFYLGYYTRFGDEASDIEPIRHLYKTQIYQFARFLGVSEEITRAVPTAGLWTGQTDEEQLGFSYKEADEVFSAYYDQKKTVDEIEKTIPTARKIIAYAKRNSFKHAVPYLLKQELTKGEM
ncbi:MAG: NAD+ synthase [bacterium]|nr:NAD+ synthase [bacterium]